MKTLKKVLIFTLVCAMSIGATSVSAKGVNECSACGSYGYKTVSTSCPICHTIVQRHYCLCGNSWTPCGHI